MKMMSKYAAYAPSEGNFSEKSALCSEKQRDTVHFCIGIRLLFFSIKKNSFSGEELR